MAATALSQEKVWFDKPSYDKAECFHFEKLAKESQGDACSMNPAVGSLADQVAKARQHIKISLQCVDNIAAGADVTMKDVPQRLSIIEKENQDLKIAVAQLQERLTKLSIQLSSVCSTPAKADVCPMKTCPAPAKPAAPAPAKAAEDDDDVDLFGSDSEGEDDEAAKIREQRLAAYAAKKSKKPVLIAKSNIILDIKPWDDETDMKAMEQEVRKIQCDGLLWGAAKLVPLAYGIKKLQISCVVEDDKVSIDWLTETIQEQEDYVQSVDIAAFNKV
ncbi:hypothetical protein HCN44_002177 [Aphidius gifuensis]|uniref:Elongation factor 1-delta n=1 Tax=Aphidius gifuensis TaxID=684658 RepID=A0A835CXG3_APHGI|nr:probable elongation factor 1-delta isoform X2 [Aphidius gifuensis]KAF7996545.1 hypothetical protein HCN44_002177 [Aphidius gifuensis]